MIGEYTPTAATSLILTQIRPPPSWPGPRFAGVC